MILWRIAAKELLDARRDRWLRWMLAFVLLVSAAAAATGWQHIRATERLRADAEAGERALWLSQGEKTAHAAAHYGFYVFRPTPPLALLDRGLDPFMPGVAHLGPHGRTLPEWAPAEDMPISVRLGMLTTATVLQIVVPLALVVLLATTLAGEREQGTLRLVCAQGVALRTLVAGKLLGAAGLLTVVLTPGLAIGLVALGTLSPPGDSAAVWWRLAAEAAVYAAFLWTFAMLLVLVSSVSRSTRQAVLLGTMVWASIVFIGPRLIADVAAYRYPAPTPAEFASRTTLDRAERPSYWDVRVPDATKRLLVQYGAARVEDLPIDPTVVAMLEEEAWDSERASRRVDWILDVHRARERLSSALSALVPAMSIQELSRAFAGTDAAHARHFEDYAEGYRQQAVRILTEDVLYRPYVDVVKTGQQNLVGADLWRRVPPFAYEVPPISWVLRDRWPSLAALGLWMIVLTAAAAWRVRRIQVD